jgi:galactokinase
MIEALHRLFDTEYGGFPDLVARAPGRVNLIGEHTDYNDGFVLPAAISKQTMVAVRRRDDATINLIAADLGNARNSFALNAIIGPDPKAPWSNYVRGMVPGLLAEGLELPGADIAIMGDMPQGSGLSSSAALENAVGLALAALAGKPDIDRVRLAQLGQRTEHDFAGCKCGIMDQLVSACASEGHALLIDCRSLETRNIAIPKGVAIMIVQSGIERGLVESKYNDRREQCEAAARHYGVAALRDLTVVPAQGSLDETAYRRARHVITENARTLAAADALAVGDLQRLGHLMAESHMSMRDDFEMSLPAIDQLQSILADAIGQEGGARLTGGGFGGAVVALLPVELIESVEGAVTAQYQTPDRQPPLILIEHAAAGASLIG